MTKTVPHETTTIRLVKRLGKAFEQFKEEVRERAYHLSLLREPGHGNPTDDWLEAQAELSEAPHFSVKEQKKNIVVEMTLKGFSPKEIEIEVAEGLLQVFGFHDETVRKKTSDGDRSTSNTRCFFQSLPLHAPVDVEHSHAKLLKNGKLKVVLAKQLTSQAEAG